MRDKDIRVSIKESLLKKYYMDSDSRVVEELNVNYGDARIDIAVINGALHGYEIKSEKDTLYRLPNQLVSYSKTFDYLTVITGSNHLLHLESLLPKWCGIIIASYIKGTKDIQLNIHRNTERNNNIDKYSIVQLLWKDEVINILKSINIIKGLSGKSKHYLWNLLANSLDEKSLSEKVREVIKLRVNWKFESPLFENDDCSSLCAK